MVKIVEERTDLVIEKFCLKFSEFINNIKIELIDDISSQVKGELVNRINPEFDDTIIASKIETFNAYEKQEILKLLNLKLKKSDEYINIGGSGSRAHNFEINENGKIFELRTGESVIKAIFRQEALEKIKTSCVALLTNFGQLFAYWGGTTIFINVGEYEMRGVICRLFCEAFDLCFGINNKYLNEKGYEPNIWFNINFDGTIKPQDKHGNYNDYIKIINLINMIGIYQRCYFDMPLEGLHAEKLKEENVASMDRLILVKVLNEELQRKEIMLNDREKNINEKMERYNKIKDLENKFKQFTDWEKSLKNRENKLKQEIKKFEEIKKVKMMDKVEIYNNFMNFMENEPGFLPVPSDVSNFINDEDIVDTVSFIDEWNGPEWQF